MTVQQGMDSARVRQVRDQLYREADRLGDLLARGDASAGVLQDNWGGEDGQQLLARWRGDAARRVGAALAMVSTAAEDLGRQADEQDAASGEPGSAGPTGPGAPPGGAAQDGDGRGRGVDAPGSGHRGYDFTGRDENAFGVLANKDSEGNTHSYDPLTGKTWQEAADGTWKRSQDPTGHRSETSVDATKGEDGWESSHESSRGSGGGRREYGESWSNERSFDEHPMQDVKKVLDTVQSEPLVEQELWNHEASAALGRGQIGDEQTGASGEFLSAGAATDGRAGVDATRGAYVEAAAEAGVYLAKGEAHWSGDQGTSAQGQAYLGAEALATGGAFLGPGGAEVAAGLEAFAGGKVEGGVSQDLGVADVGVSGELSYGIGAHADASAEFSVDKVGVSFDVGLTLGVGGGVEFDVSISPKELLGGLQDAGGAVSEGLSWINPFD